MSRLAPYIAVIVVCFAFGWANARFRLVDPQAAVILTMAIGLVTGAVFKQLSKRTGARPRPTGPKGATREAGAPTPIRPEGPR
jgi:hypothetical protein